MKRPYWIAVLIVLAGVFVLLHQYIPDDISLHAPETEHHRVIKQFYRDNQRFTTKPVVERIAIASEFFLGKKYLLGALGEGDQGQFDQGPLFRTDAFDCMTYVSTVIALSKADNFNDFLQHIRRIRYHQGNIAFEHRNHFTSLDWNPHNIEAGYLRDVTQNVVDHNKQAISIQATSLIDKPNWYRHFTANSLKLRKPLSHAEKNKRLQALQAISKQVSAQQAAILYLPLSKLFTSDGNPVENLFQQIPHGAVVEIVRPDWALRDKIGTNLHVSHMGFAIRTADGLMYREASSTNGKIIDIPLSEYLQAYLNSPTVKGINVLTVE